MGKTSAKNNYRTGDEKKINVCFKLRCSPTSLLEEHWKNTGGGKEWFVTLYYLNLPDGKLIRIWVMLVYTNFKSNFVYVRGKCSTLSFSFFPLSLYFWKTFPFLLSYKPARRKNIIAFCITDTYLQGLEGPRLQL